MRKPYIGVTDFATRAQIEACKALIPESCGRILHAGLMCSVKTVRGQPTQMGWEKFWPTEEAIREMFVSDSLVLNCIHYVDYSEKPCRTKPADLQEALRRAGPFVGAIQLDMLWPEEALLGALKGSNPQAEVILQVSSRAMEKRQDWDMHCEALCKAGLCDHFLVDFGMGRGIEFDPGVAVETVSRLADRIGDARVSVAGGLGPQTYANAGPVFEKWPGCGCDAQGKLRSSGSALDPLEMDRVEGYVRGIVGLLDK